LIINDKNKKKINYYTMSSFVFISQDFFLIVFKIKNNTKWWKLDFCKFFYYYYLNYIFKWYIVKTIMFKWLNNI